MNTTRIFFGFKQEMWIDFSSWLRNGNAGMYVVATLRKEEDCGVFASLCSESIAAPSKYFACLYDIAKKAFDVAFLYTGERDNVSSFEVYPIIRSNDNQFQYYHKMVTLEDLQKSLLIDNSTESSDESS